MHSGGQKADWNKIRGSFLFFCENQVPIHEKEHVVLFFLVFVSFRFSPLLRMNLSMISSSQGFYHQRHNKTISSSMAVQ